MKCIRKFTPVSPYDIQGLESWLEDQSLRGLFLVKFGTTFSIFAQGVPKRTGTGWNTANPTTPTSLPKTCWTCTGTLAGSSCAGLGTSTCPSSAPRTPRRRSPTLTRLSRGRCWRRWQSG